MPVLRTFNVTVNLSQIYGMCISYSCWCVPISGTLLPAFRPDNCLFPYSHDFFSQLLLPVLSQVIVTKSVKHACTRIAGRAAANIRLTLCAGRELFSPSLGTYSQMDWARWPYTRDTYLKISSQFHG